MEWGKQEINSSEVSFSLSLESTWLMGSSGAWLTLECWSSWRQRHKALCPHYQSLTGHKGPCGGRTWSKISQIFPGKMTSSQRFFLFFFLRNCTYEQLAANTPSSWGDGFCTDERKETWLKSQQPLLELLSLSSTFV